LHTAASAAERAILEPVIFSKSVDYRRDVKCGKINRNERTDALLARYKEQVRK